MLKKISPVISPELLKTLCEMGHGDELLIADGNYPAGCCPSRVIRADGHGVTEILKAVLELFPLDSYAPGNAVFMEVVKGDNIVPAIWTDMKALVKSDANGKPASLERFAFYDRAKKAYAAVATGETAIYANIILKKGVVIY